MITPLFEVKKEIPVNVRQSLANGGWGVSRLLPGNPPLVFLVEGPRLFEAAG
jgi:hypothetical protein